MENIWSGLVSTRYCDDGTLMLTLDVVIVLIAAEIVVAAVNIIVDLYAGD
jgi:hypothetical protein